MDESQLVQFIRGMAYHDIAKPFWLGNRWHTFVGYAMLVALGQGETEALAALCHSYRDLKRNLIHYQQFRQSTVRLPACLMLAPALDGIATSSYALMDETLQGPGSIQNPFSRLPKTHHEMGSLTQPGDGARLANERFRRHWQAAFQPGREWTAVEETIGILGQDDGDGRELETLIRDFEGLTWDHVHPYLDIFAERTYPPMNDTSLSQHGRLSAALALIVYANLAHQSPQFLSQCVTYDGQAFRLDGQDLFDEFFRFTERDYSPARRLAIGHLDCAVMRIGLMGLQEMFETAVRLDDLQGVKQLADRIREALKRTLLQETLGLSPEACTELADLLPLSESPFELVYLMPESIGTLDEVERDLTTAYRKALESVVGNHRSGLIRELIEDFRGAEKPMPFAAERETLIEQLTTLSIGMQWMPVKPRLADHQTPNDVDYSTWQASFGRGLLGAYVEALREDLLLPLHEMERIKATLVAAEPLAADQICEACGTNPCFGPFQEDLPPDSLLRKVVHDFRGRSERLCLMCVARRILSHAQMRVSALEEMIRWDPSDPQQLQLRIEAKEGGLPLPPILARSGKLEHPDDYIDLGAAFVRRFPKKPTRTDGPQIFPTIGYAADANSNVVLITLTHADSLFQTYSYHPAREYVNALSARDREQEDIKLFEDYYLRIYEDAKEYPGEEETEREVLADAIIEVQPHLARVMERIRRLEAFYQALPAALEDEKVRVLPLETRWPVCRLMVPADALLSALKVIDRMIITQLFSGRSRAKATREFLNRTVPDLLLGTLIAFKQKQALYLVLAAERALLRRLAQADPQETGAGKRNENIIEWRGLRLGLCDLRGTLTEIGPWHAQVLLGNLHEVLAIADLVDRRSVESAAALQQKDHQIRLRTSPSRGSEVGPYTDLAAALLHIRGGRAGWGRKIKETLGEEYIFDPLRDHIFAPVLFLKRMTRS